MVRFINDYKLICLGVLNNLHSTMVRFITADDPAIADVTKIYIPLWLDLLLSKCIKA